MRTHLIRVLILAGLGLASSLAAASPERVIYTFTGGASGSNPEAAVIADSSGALYGTTFAGGTASVGTIYKLTPPAAGHTQWTHTVLYSFAGGQDGANPLAALLADTSGALYGTTSKGGTYGYGTVFKVTPPAAGGSVWTETILHSFNGSGGDGANPTAALIGDSKGNLYGTAGTIFELSPPTAGDTEWTETLIANSYYYYSTAPLVADSKGLIYGVSARDQTYGSGSIFELIPPTSEGAAWTQTTLYNFVPSVSPFVIPPETALMIDSSGALYGTTPAADWSFDDSGTVFKLIPPPASGQTGWAIRILYAFAPEAGAPPIGHGSLGALVRDSRGALYGSDSIDGLVLKLTPPKNGAFFWTPTVLCSFGYDEYDDDPISSLAFANGALFGVTAYGGKSGAGTVFKLLP